MTTDTITIQAEDAVLNLTTNGKQAIYIKENTKIESGVLHFNARFTYVTDADDGVTYWYYNSGDVDADTATVKLAKKHEDGNIIVYVTPSKSGTYSVQATYGTKGAARIGYLIEDESTTEDSYYQHYRIGAATDSISDFAQMEKFGTHEFGNTYRWVAGKTYAIHILASSGSIAYDQFTISHIHEYDDENDTTCNGCGEERCLHPHTVAYDDTHHWFDYSCDCGLTEEKVEHSYTNGVCECGKERVFAMPGETITIDAQDVVLNTQYVTLITNNNVTGRKLVKLSSNHSAHINGAYVTSLQHSGDVVVYVTPSVSGTYSVVAKGVYTKSSTITGVMIEDISTAGTTKYTYQSIASALSTPTEDFVKGSIEDLTILGEQQWIAGHTYAIRIACGNARTALDQFVITCTNPA